MNIFQVLFYATHVLFYIRFVDSFFTAQKDTPHTHVVHHTGRGPVKLPIPTELPSIFWLHIQKTGTSIGNTFVLYACPAILDLVKNFDEKAWGGRTKVRIAF